MTAPKHELKCWPVYFQRVWTGEKTFEVRLDDRGFQRGDTVVLREWDRNDSCNCVGDHSAHCAKYSGRTISARIGHVMASTPPRGNQRGFVGMGYVVFSLCDPQRHDGRPAQQDIEIRVTEAAVGSASARATIAHRIATASERSRL